MEMKNKEDGCSISAEHKLIFPAAVGKSGDSQHIFQIPSKKQNLGSS